MYVVSFDEASRLLTAYQDRDVGLVLEAVVFEVVVHLLPGYQVTCTHRS